MSPTSTTDSSNILSCDGALTPTLDIGGKSYQSSRNGRPTAPTPELPRLDGYEILGELGRGGMGVVYKARQTSLNRVVALKMLLGGAFPDEDQLIRFRREAEAVARLQHPNIIQVFEVGTVRPLRGEPNPSPFIALEFIDGGSLTRFTDAPQPPIFAARMVEKLARAAHAAHHLGVIHRDLKPANVLLTRDGEPKIADFGIAKQIGEWTDSESRFLTQAGTAMGTPEYMSPEQVAGDDPTPAVDIHALGVLLYQLLTARVPFQGATPADTMYLVRNQEPVSPRRLQPGLPLDLETICLKCLAKTPGRRYETADALADDLARWADKRPIRARPVGAVERAVRWARREPTVAALSAAVVLVALAGVWGVVWKWQDAETQAAAATTAAGEARERAAAERWERYRADIVAASNALQLHNTGAARRALDAAPAEYRHWEWQYFSQQLDTSLVTLGGSGPRVHWAVIAPGAGTVVTVADDDTARFWDVSGRREIGHTAHVPEVGRSTISPGGDTIASIPLAPADNILTLRDTRTGEIREVLRGHDSPIMTTHYSPDGTRLATGGRDGTVRIWDAATGRPVLTFKAHNAPTGMLAFTADGRRLATSGTFERNVRVWDVETGALLSTLGKHDWNVDAVGYNRAGDRMLTASWYPANSLKLWDATAGKEITDLSGHTNAMQAFAFSPDGSRIATASMDQTACLWDGRTGRLVSVLRGHSGWVNHVTFSPDGTQLVSSSRDSTLRLWDAATGRPLGVMHGHGGGVLKSAYTADGKTLVSASQDATVKLWDPRRAGADNTLHGHTKFVYGVAFHPDGERVVSVSWDGTARIWDATTGHQLAQLNCGGDQTIVSAVALHPAGQLAATVSRDDAVRLWDIPSGREVHRWAVPTNFWQDTRIAFSPQGDLLAAGDRDCGVRLWDVAGRTELAVLKGHQSRVRDLVFGPDGRWLATAADLGDKTIRIWDVARRETVHVLAGHADGVYSLAVNRAGTLIASGSLDGTVRLWDTATWAEVAVLKHGTNVYGLAFTPDGLRLASACADNTIRFWDVATRQEVAELRGHADYVHSIAFSPDGTRLVSGSGDYTVRIWDTLPYRQRTR